MRTVTLWNGRQVDRRLYWWAMGRIGSEGNMAIIHLAMDLKLSLNTRRDEPVEDTAHIVLMREWMKQAGTPPPVRINE
jgi:hypothetical protein